MKTPPTTPFPCSPGTETTMSSRFESACVLDGPDTPAPSVCTDSFPEQDVDPEILPIAEPVSIVQPSSTLGANYFELNLKRKRIMEEFEAVKEAIRVHPETKRIRAQHALHTFFLPLKMDKITEVRVKTVLRERKPDVTLYWHTCSVLGSEPADQMAIIGDTMVELEIEFQDYTIHWGTGRSATGNRPIARDFTFLYIHRTGLPITTAVGVKDVNVVDVNTQNKMLKTIGVVANDVDYDLSLIMRVTQNVDPTFFDLHNVLSLIRNYPDDCIINEQSAFSKAVRSNMVKNMYQS